MRFQGKTAIVTGAASGIGRATAQAFVREGANVLAADVQPCDVEGVIGVRCDVTQAGEVEALVARAVEEFGRLDCAVNNAGIEGSRAPLAEYDDAAWTRVIDVNLNAVFFCLKHELRAMERQGGGAIVNVASIFGCAAPVTRRRTWPRSTAWSASPAPRRSRWRRRGSASTRSAPATRRRRW